MENCQGQISPDISVRKLCTELLFRLKPISRDSGRASMSTLGLIEYKDASPEVRAVYDDIMATRKTDWVINFWKAIAHDPGTLKRIWEDIKQIMAPGALERRRIVRDRFPEI